MFRGLSAHVWVGPPQGQGRARTAPARRRATSRVTCHDAVLSLVSRVPIAKFQTVCLSTVKYSYRVNTLRTLTTHLCRSVGTRVTRCSAFAPALFSTFSTFSTQPCARSHNRSLTRHSPRHSPWRQQQTLHTRTHASTRAFSSEECPTLVTCPVRQTLDRPSTGPRQTLDRPSTPSTPGLRTVS